MPRRGERADRVKPRAHSGGRERRPSRPTARSRAPRLRRGRSGRDSGLSRRSRRAPWARRPRRAVRRSSGRPERSGRTGSGRGGTSAGGTRPAGVPRRRRPARRPPPTRAASDGRTRRRGARRRRRVRGRRSVATADAPVASSPTSRERLEVEREVARRLEPLLRVLLEAVPHDPLEPGLDVLVRRREIRRLLSQDRRHRLRRRVAAERALAREHLVEDRAEGEDVRARVRRLALAPAPATCSRSCPSRRPARCPRSVGRSVCCSPSVLAISFARPKSRILTRPSFVTNRFSGFRSRWTIPFSCAAARPLAICTA